MPANTLHTPPRNRRRHPRHTAPLTVIIGATPYTVADWSEGGLRLRNYGGLLDAPSTTYLRVLLPADDTAGIFPCAGRVVRRDPRTGDLALALEPLGPLGRGHLNRYLQSHSVIGQA